ncbi:NAD(P)-binding protein [Periconia macrospinosa]|uniref:NAD(P)-binding protein n=1 Tax=Periconia macrospinosa TaxID=97972 RepID=A0A2V1D7H9_9PLEO|nr:NAD(P)-binding protein [Periconia macrospinosa]
MKYINKLKDHHVLVIGGSSGLGLCVAEAAIEYGATVIISGSSQANLDAAISHLCQLQNLQQCPGDASRKIVSSYACDLSVPEMQEHNLGKLLHSVTDGGRKLLDHVVFTAGNEIPMPTVDEVTPEDVKVMQAVRFLAPIMLAKLLPRYIKASPLSSLTLTGGTKALKPSPGWAVMAGLISSVKGLTRGLAVDLQPIRVNAVFPGAVRSSAALKMDSSELEKKMALFRQVTLTGTVGTPEEVAEAYLYCMRSTYTTGTVIVADGGRLLK